MQVHLTDHSADEVNLQMRAALLQLAEQEGMVEASSPNEADRTICFAAPAGAAWAAVYDSATEGQNSEVLDELATHLSRALSTEAVSIVVYDSDVLEMRLYDNGQPRDQYNSNPEYFGEASSTAKQQLAGQPKRWASLGADAGALQAAWRERALFAEQTLDRTAALLAMPADQVRTGFNYLSDSGVEVVRLPFRFARKPAWREGPGGPPRFEGPGAELTIELQVGQRLQTVANLRSVGGAGKGLSVLIWGSALSLVDVEQVEVVLQTGDLHNPGGFERHKLPATEIMTDEGPALTARFEQLDIPAGVDQAAMARAPAAERGTMMGLWMRSTICINVIGRCREAGTGDLHIALRPHDNPDGAALQTTTVVLTSQP